ncbi:hypothetical protein EJ05DRAFT_160670 [Pseudovirgaria hyperparasitica]|uniref:UBA domain-containing protein n=1 Tax=Pseudovirgaria hyperparasitica TaxID=470096 RepID=A0A6A6VXG2_9PEZI|nr:uncharacterized protein EJ05DRAFT_160670 [Pseudovirgaria hyperparasitica]KAF2753941.1 hypothetical protein EJ05DRAFT_160670 [Pseudovirgaria hyperparasitica]
MDDLSGLNWSSGSNGQPSNIKANFPTMNRPMNMALSPANSGRSTPLSSQNSGAFSSLPAQKPKIGSKPSTPANDSFASLVTSASSPKPPAALSLQERQRQLLEEKARQAGLNHTNQDAHFWDNLGQTDKGKAPSSFPVPSINRVHSPLQQTVSTPQSESEQDILAAFSSDAKVDSSSHFPPPAQDHTPFENDDDDDPFGLGSLPQNKVQPVAANPTHPEQDDDILGMLGKPVSELPRNANEKTKPAHVTRELSPNENVSSPRDKAVAEIVDMGFPADRAARALAQTQSGTNVQQAVSILLNQAHQEATERSQGSGRSRPDSRDRSDRRASPAWAQENTSRPSSRPARGDNRTSTAEKDVAQYAQDIGSSLFKSANSLWKTSQKKVQRAVADFNQDGDPSQPKWMRDAMKAQAQAAQHEEERSTSRQRNGGGSDRNDILQTDTRVTNEAMALEASHGPPRRNKAPERGPSPMDASLRGRLSELPSREAPAWASDNVRRPEPEKRPIAKLSRQDVEDQSAQAYVSPARRKKAGPPPAEPQKVSSSESRAAVSTPLNSNNPFAQRPNSQNPTSAPRNSAPIEVRPKVPTRNIPNVSPTALSTSAAHRQKGTEQFKRGDYSAAHSSYSSALTQIPSTHPIIIVILSNRALTSLKNGDPKSAVADADGVLMIIGPSKGHGEKISMGGTEPDKDMRDFFGKALMRKAEALENMEKWHDALKVWREAVEAGVGGSVSMQGRNRCEKAIAPKPATKSAAPKTKPRPAPFTSAMADFGGALSDGSEAASVKRLREANAAADKADDEKFRLSDQVDARLMAWKGTKADNLRALLGSLDNVLWPEAGWKKVGMNELVMPNKVKIVYMKAIAKVHPDKVSQTATTEQKMISASVFSTLNEAWDKFKTDNNL